MASNNRVDKHSWEIPLKFVMSFALKLGPKISPLLITEINQ